MKHSTSRLMFSYWDSVRGDRAAPESRAIDPGPLRQVLADTFLLGSKPDGSTQFRLAGTRISALFGRGLKDAAFASLWPASRRSEPESLIDIVGGDGSGLVAGLTGSTELGATVGLELLLLPLRHEGGGDSRLLGALSAIATPSWAGLVPITELELLSVRVIRTGAEQRAQIQDRSLAPAERRQRFVLVEGGLAASRA